MNVDIFPNWKPSFSYRSHSLLKEIHQNMGSKMVMPSSNQTWLAGNPSFVGVLTNDFPSTDRFTRDGHV